MVTVLCGFVATSNTFHIKHDHFVNIKISIRAAVNKIIAGFLQSEQPVSFQTDY